MPEEPTKAIKLLKACGLEVIYNRNDDFYTLYPSDSEAKVYGIPCISSRAMKSMNDVLGLMDED